MTPAAVMASRAAAAAAVSPARMLVEELESRLADLDVREAQLAEAYETLSQTPAVQAAFTEGQQAERLRVVALIDHHLSTLKRSGHNAIALDALRRQITDPL